MSEGPEMNPLDDLKREVVSVVAAEVKKHVTSASGRKALAGFGTTNVMMLVITMWIWHNIDPYLKALKELVEYKRLTVQTRDFEDWIDATADRNPDWRPARFVVRGERARATPYDAPSSRSPRQSDTTDNTRHIVASPPRFIAKEEFDNDPKTEETAN